MGREFNKAAGFSLLQSHGHCWNVCVQGTWGVCAHFLGWSALGASRTVPVCTVCSTLSSLRQMLSCIWICDYSWATVFWCWCAPWGIYISVGVEGLHAGAQYHLFQPQERPDFTSINPSLRHASFSAVLGCAAFWNVPTNIWHISSGYFPYGLIFHSSVKSHMQMLFSYLLLYTKSRVSKNF